MSAAVWPPISHEQLIEEEENSLVPQDQQNIPGSIRIMTHCRPANLNGF